jgi:hypothetical protein
MPNKTMQVATPGLKTHARTIQFIKHTVIGSVTTSEYGDIDAMAAFFNAVEGDAREQMNPDTVTEDIYEMTDTLGTTVITVKHDPHSAK